MSVLIAFFCCVLFVFVFIKIIKSLGNEIGKTNKETEEHNFDNCTELLKRAI